MTKILFGQQPFRDMIDRESKKFIGLHKASEEQLLAAKELISKFNIHFPSVKHFQIDSISSYGKVQLKLLKKKSEPKNV